MTLRIAAQEFRYLFVSLQTLLTFGALFGLTFLLTANAGEFTSFAPGGAVLANSPYAITDTLIKLSVFLIFAVPPFISSSILKDVESHFAPFIFSAPISKASYLNGRFLGSFAALLCAFTGAPLGMLLGTFFPWADRALLGPTNLWHYTVVFLGIITPSLLAVSSLIFAVTVLTRSMIYTYISAIALLLFYLLGSEAFLPSILDPFMFRIFAESTEYWTAIERNNQLLPFAERVLANRALWLLVAGVAYGLTYRVFSFRKIAGSIARPKKVALVAGVAPTAMRRSQPLRVAPAWKFSTHFKQFTTRLRFEARAVLTSPAFLILMALCSLLLFFSLTDREIMYGVNAHPLTRLMLGGFSSLTLPLLAVSAFYGAEIIWRERSAQCHEILDALPVPNWVFVVSKVGALLGIMVAIFGLGLVMSIGIQLAAGYRNLELGLYLERGILINLLPTLYFAILACFFQVIVRNRYFGMALIGLFLAALVASRDVLGWEDPLLSYGFPAIPAPISDMNRAGGLSALAYWVRAYWAAIAGFLLITSYLLWPRGVMQPLRYRLRGLRALRAPAFLVPAAFFLSLGVASAGVLYYNSHILNTYVTESEGLDYRQEYEEQYRQYEILPMPRTVAIDIDVDLYPLQRRIAVRSVHLLQNKTEQELSVVHVVFPTAATIHHVELAGAAEYRKNDDPFNHYMIDLAEPMQPGEQHELTFALTIEHRGFEHNGPETTLVRNGTFIQNSQIAPYIGFHPEYMIEDNDDRVRRGLPELPRRPALEDLAQHYNNPTRQDSDFIEFRTTVSTVSPQRAIAPGDLEKEWTEGDRRFFTYSMNSPIRNFYCYLSAEYEVERAQWGDVDIEVLHHAPHRYNLERMIEASQDSLAYFSKEFSPYPYKQLRIIEVPAYRAFAQSFPTTIPYSESMGFVADVQDGDLDMPYYVTAHEIAHQWWGHQVTAANTQGDGFIHETLAQYSALLVMEQEYGTHRIRSFLKQELDRYLSGRTRESSHEMPLYREEDQDYIHYRKGSLIMYSLRDYLGTETVNRAIRRLIELHAYSSAPYTTSLDFLTILKEEAGPQHLGMIEDLFERITLYDLSLDAGRVEKMPDGRYKVTLDLGAVKLYAQPDGTEQAADMDLGVDIGLFLRDPGAKAFNEQDVLLLERRHLDGRQTTLEIVVDQKPLFAGIDPYHKLIDRASEDNLKRLATLN